jgi:hypothetical protein
MLVIRDAHKHGTFLALAPVQTTAVFSRGYLLMSFVSISVPF